jgi:hypothetical protein
VTVFEALPTTSEHPWRKAPGCWLASEGRWWHPQPQHVERQASQVSVGLGAEPGAWLQARLNIPDQDYEQPGKRVIVCGMGWCWE